MSSGKVAPEEIIDNFRELAVKHSEAAEKSDYRKANKIFDELESLFKRFQGDETLEEIVITTLLKDDDIRIRVQASMKALRLKKHIQESMNIIEEAQHQTVFRILRVDSHMALKVWQERGTF